MYVQAKFWILAGGICLGAAGCDVQNAANRGGFTVDIGGGYRGNYQRGDYNKIGYRPERQDEDYEGVGVERGGIRRLAR
jgi:hypothetical protein